MAVGDPVMAERAQAQMKEVGHPVTAVLLVFRSLDTMLELAILVLALLGTLAIRGSSGLAAVALSPPHDPILAGTVRILVPLAVLVAGYLLWLGTFAPGGAFQSGVVLGAAGVLLWLSPYRSIEAAPSWLWHALVMLGFAAFLALADDDLAGCADYLAEARDAAVTCHDPTLPAIVRFVEAAAQLRDGRYDDAEPTLQDALAGFRTSGDRWGQVQCLIALIGLAELTQRPDPAVAHADDALKIAVELGMPDLELFLHTRRAELSRTSGDHELADSAIASARRVADELRPELPDHPSTVAAASHNPEAQAIAAHQEVVAWLRRSQVPDQLAYTLGRLGAVQLTTELEDDDPDAPGSDDPQQQRIAHALETLAAVRLPADADRAAYLLGAADTLRGDPTATRSPAGQQAQRAAANALGDRPFTVAIQRGRVASRAELRDLPAAAIDEDGLGSRRESGLVCKHTLCGRAVRGGRTGRARARSSHVWNDRQRRSRERQPIRVEGLRHQRAVPDEEQVPRDRGQEPDAEPLPLRCRRLRRHRPRNYKTPRAPVTPCDRALRRPCARGRRAARSGPA